MTTTVIHAAPVLSTSSVGKGFFGQEAVRGLSIELHPGVHGLYGPAGSGKTTVVRLLTGALLADAGSITTHGRVLAAGGGSLLPGRTVAANLHLGREPRTEGLVDRQRMVADAAAFLGDLGLGEIDPQIRVLALDARATLLFECACALAWGVSLFVVDDADPADDQVQHALRVIADRGVTVLQLSKDLGGLLERCDTVAVLDAVLTDDS